ncbi:CobW GTPase involved in cobalt insertion for B12 biosynthesis [Rubellimicrobium mesophilum DSM 19309]|uniref:CobW GTPase involved in cobalt insertion for B12 biosynthesis n=1 Tax=Rubellimicrobium mesophilum DSM 19309 TaxID=442562 RepID=A0A017HI28_9RHOB|nr:cobalamin biosynthesis protein CobW [Rubellimicrobium mesophilum]EYD73975.1 CobW GTPase involved in cobalt insertion for B12 biosynthesis [Rubellimicrobium mesophilum DSM 19309]
MPQKIPATVITGFLGSGKTTMIRHLLDNAEGRRIALVINEFGETGVDGDLLKGCCAEDDIIELSNGCICCTVADDFLPTMEKLLARPDKPDHIVIETSGLALPQPLVRAFAWPGISTRVTVDGVVTVVDGKAVAEGRFAEDESAIEAQRQSDDSIDHETPLSELFEDQIACADMIVLNKADLLSGTEAADVARQLAEEARPGARVLVAQKGALPLDVILGIKAAAETDMETRSAPHHDNEEEGHDHDEFESFVLDLPEVPDVAALTQRLASAIEAHDILRLKGFVAVAGKPLRLTVQAAGPRIETYFDRPWGTSPRESKLVVIGEAGLDRTAIEEAIRG